MDDYDDDDDGGGDNTSASSGLKRLGASLGLKLRPWEGPGVRSAKSEVSLIDFTDDSFSSTTPSPLTETRQPDEDTLKVRRERGCHRSTYVTCWLNKCGIISEESFSYSVFYSFFLMLQ